MKKLGLALTHLLILTSCTTPQKSTELLAPPASIQVQSDRRNSAAAMRTPYVVVVSIDGYRWDYTERYAPPNLSRIAREGSSAESLLPTFPSKTFPSHYSIATGLYPEKHGIVANYFYDLSRPAEKTLYKLSDREAIRDASWYSGTPIWVAAEKAGILTAPYFWPGSEAKIQGVLPTYCVAYDGKVPNSDRVEQALAWLRLPDEQRPHYVSVYFSSVDVAGHVHGTDSPELKEAVLKVDEVIGRLLTGINALSFPVNLIILSDHGMQDIDPKHVLYIDEYTDLAGVTVGDLGPQALLYDTGAGPKRMEQIYRDLKKQAKHFKVYRRKEVPRSLHYSKNPRVGDIVVMADSPYYLGIHDKRFTLPKANHGYDPVKVKTMHGIFYAKGPDIQSGVRLKPFENIHIYPLMMRILGLELPRAIDGRPSVLADRLSRLP